MSQAPLTPTEIREVYRAILSRTPNHDPARARQGLEAYLAGRDRILPRKVKP